MCSLGLILALWLGLAPAAGAPKAGPERVRIPFWIEAEGEEERLAADDLSAWLEGATSRIMSLQGPGDDLILLLVLDLADELTAGAVAKQVLIEELRGLPANTYIGLLRAQDGLQVIVDPTPDRATVEQAIQDVPISGKPGLLETLELAGRIADGILKKAAVRVAVWYVTDSDVRSYREDL
ncbi:MAG: hypothetical protein FJW37_13505 [Acidobacteria bacterium]|nr:hypothetical protein [Acidobacteriota bacterium]